MKFRELPGLSEGTEPVSFTDPLHHLAHEFLVREAEALDERRFRDWAAMLTADVKYRMPVRVTATGGEQFELLSGMAHFDEDRFSLLKRIERFETEFAWTEDPPSRVRRFVTNVRVSRLPDPGRVLARSYVLLFRSRGDTREAEYVSAERHDILHDDQPGFRLAHREIVVDESVLRTQNLAIFL